MYDQLLITSSSKRSTPAGKEPQSNRITSLAFRCRCVCVHKRVKLESQRRLSKRSKINGLVVTALPFPVIRPFPTPSPSSNVTLVDVSDLSNLVEESFSVIKLVDRNFRFRVPKPNPCLAISNLSSGRAKDRIRAETA